MSPKGDGSGSSFAVTVTPPEKEHVVASRSPLLHHSLHNEPLIKIVDNYVNYYASGVGHTARAKRYDLQYFLEFLAGGSYPVDQVLVEHWTLHKTQEFIDYRLSIGESPATVGRRLATIKHFGRTLAERVHGYINPAREVKAPTQQSSRPHGLSTDEISALRAAALDLVSRHKSHFIGIRNQFILELLLATGLRADEIRLLTIGQIGDDYSWLKNVKTKGRKFRNVYVDSSVRSLFDAYLPLREAEILKRFPEYTDLPRADAFRYPVFISLARATLGAPSTFGLSPKSIWRTISTIGREAQRYSSSKIFQLHPHLLRHTFAHGLLDSSKDIRLVAQALGHSDVRTTMRYTERTEAELAHAIEKKLSRC